MDVCIFVFEVVLKKLVNLFVVLVCIWVLIKVFIFGWWLYFGLVGFVFKKEYCIFVVGLLYKCLFICSNWLWIILFVLINSVSNSKIRMIKVEIYLVYIYFSRLSFDLCCLWFCMLFFIFIIVLFSVIYCRICCFSWFEFVFFFCF